MIMRPGTLMLGKWIDIMGKKAMLAIIGAGVAGLTAALVAARNGLKIVVFESKNAGGRAGGIPYIETFPGLGRIKGTMFVKSLKAQVEGYPNIELLELEQVKEIKLNDDHFTLITNNREQDFEYVILAMGADHKHLNIPGETEFKGSGVSYCASCDGLFFRNKSTLVIGNDTHSLEQALFLDELGSNVTLITQEPELNAESKLCNDLLSTSVNVVHDMNVREIMGERLVSGVKLARAGDVGNEHKQIRTEFDTKMELEAKGVFISVGQVPRIDIVKDIGVSFNTEGYIEIDDRFKTKIPNMYAIGDLTSPGLELVSVCASGANAVSHILNRIKRKKKSTWK